MHLKSTSDCNQSTFIDDDWWVFVFFLNKTDHKYYHLPAKVLVNFYTAIIESIITSSIIVWFAAATGTRPSCRAGQPGLLPTPLTPDSICHSSSPWSSPSGPELHTTVTVCSLLQTVCWAVPPQSPTNNSFTIYFSSLCIYSDLYIFVSFSWLLTFIWHILQRLTFTVYLDFYCFYDL